MAFGFGLLIYCFGVFVSSCCLGLVVWCLWVVVFWVCVRLLLLGLAGLLLLGGVGFGGGVFVWVFWVVVCLGLLSFGLVGC